MLSRGQRLTGIHSLLTKNKQKKSGAKKQIFYGDKLINFHSIVTFLPFNYLIPTIKHDGTGMMIWPCSAATGHCHGCCHWVDHEPWPQNKFPNECLKAQASTWLEWISTNLNNLKQHCKEEWTRSHMENNYFKLFHVTLMFIWGCI